MEIIFQITIFNYMMINIINDVILKFTTIKSTKDSYI